MRREQVPGTQVGPGGQQEGGSWEAEEGLYARGWNQAEWQDWEGVEVGKDSTAQEAQRQGWDAERALGAAGLRGAQVLHWGSRRKGLAKRHLEQSRGQGCQGQQAAEQQGW